MQEGFFRSVGAGGVETIFRHPNTGDLDAFIEMHRTLTREKVMCRRLILDRDSGSRMLSEARDRLDRGTGTYLLVERDGALVGEGFAKCSGHEYFTVGLALIERVRGMGIGTELMGIIEKECLRLDGSRLHLAVYAANKPAIHVYEQVGFQVSGCLPDWVLLDDGSTCDLLEMTKLMH